MRKLLMAMVAAITVFLASTVCFAETRVYDTNYGLMRLQVDGTFISGTYTHDNGRIEGTLDGTVMRGTWRQNTGKGACIFTFSPDFTSFEAQWNYAGETGWRSNWSGRLKSGSGTSQGADFKRSYSTEYGAMKLHFNGDMVTGSYTHQNGKLKGTLDGAVLTGTWTQNNGSGSLVFKFDDDYRTFQGKWNYKGEHSMRGGWNGRPE